MRHLFGIVVGVVLAAALFFGGGWGFHRLVSLTNVTSAQLTSTRGLTSLAAMLGMLPLALALGSGSELLQPLAIAVMGGLAFALMLSLVVTPSVYAMIHERRLT